MAEIWLATEVHLNSNEYQTDEYKTKTILDFAKPTLSQIERQCTITTFHFFFEPFFLFRVEITDTAMRDKVKQIVEGNLKSIQNMIAKTVYNENYTGEQDDFGTEGWLYVKKLFESASRVSILKHETFAGIKSTSDCQIQKQFNDAKLIHCFLNAQGLSFFEEAAFHNKCNFERLVRAFGFS
jgi:hypothetical protein